MKVCLILEVETLDHELIALFRQQTINYFNGKACAGEVTPLIRQSYMRTTELIADMVIQKLIVPVGDAFPVVKLIDSRWDSVDVVSKEEEATILAPPG